MEKHTHNTTGWLPDPPDVRDYTVNSPEVATLLENTSVLELAMAGPKAPQLPEKVDLRRYCSPIEDQGSLGSCTAQAGVALYEYLARRAFGAHEELSRRFLYKVTRSMLGWSGDTGAFLRSTMGAMVAFGAPPERHWGYDIVAFDAEPSPFAYAFAQNYKASAYFRLDPPALAKDDVLTAIKQQLHSKLPSMFGFTVYTSIDAAAANGEIPMPGPREKVRGGHAVVAIGYDDTKVIKGAKPTKGAIRIRNSWGTAWGDDGYGWLPYEYVTAGIAQDFWVLVGAAHLATNAFQAG